MDDEMIMGQDDNSFVEPIGVAENGNDVAGAFAGGVGLGGVSTDPATDNVSMSGTDDVTSDGLIGDSAHESFAASNHDVESDSDMNREEEDVPWAGACDDKCCRCNVNSSKGFY